MPDCLSTIQRIIRIITPYTEISEGLFGQRSRRGRSPVEHRGNLCVRPSVRPSVHLSFRPPPLGLQRPAKPSHKLAQAPLSLGQTPLSLGQAPRSLDPRFKWHGLGLTEPDPGLIEPGLGLTEPSPGLTKPGLGLTEPGPGVS